MPADPKLALDSPRWSELATRNGDAAWVSQAIRDVTTASTDRALFREFWPELCSEGTTYTAAYAAAPYLVSLAASDPSDSAEYLIVLGLIATSEGLVPADLEPAYRLAVADALSATLGRLAERPTGHTLRYLLAAVAAFSDRRDLADALQNLDAIQETCPNCGGTVFPSELQQIAARDAD